MNHHKLTIEQMLEILQLSDPTDDTYLYIDDVGELCATEKPNRDARPSDEFESIGYVTAFERS